MKPGAINESQAMKCFTQRQALGEAMLAKHDMVLVEDKSGGRITMGDMSEALSGTKGMVRAGAAMMIKNLWEKIQGMSEATKIGSIGDFDKFAYPMVTIVYPNLVAHTLVSVQPMEGPVSLIFYMQALYNQSKSPSAAGQNMITDPNPLFATESVTEETIDVGDGGAAYTGTASWIPVRPNTVSITDGVETFTDNGATILTGSLGGTGTIVYSTGAIALTFNGVVVLGTPITATYEYDLEGNEEVPEIDLNLIQVPVTARPSKLAAKWTLEGAYNLKKLHGMEAEVELVAACTNELKFSIDQRIITNLWNGTSNSIPTWSQTPDAGVSYAEHQLSFVKTLVAGGNKIFKTSGRAKAEWMVCGLNAASVIEVLPGYEGTGKLAGRGIYESGILNGTWRIIQDSYFTDNNFLLGYKGDSMFNTGYVFSPYLLFYTTPTYTLVDFVSRKGFATEYGMKMVDANFFCKGAVS